MIKRKRIMDLVVNGGIPTFRDEIHVGRPNIGNRKKFIARVNDILNRRWLTNNGKYVQEFESKVSEYLGVKHCIAMCNGTIALEIAIKALELKGEVILPAMTFIATAHALQWQEIKPVFCDIDLDTLCLDLNEVERHITPSTTGIIGVHAFGRSCEIEKLQEIADRNRIKLMFDAAHAFGCSYRGRMIGNFGNAEVMSFHATKFINTFEGGAVLTNDDKLAEKVRLMKNFGFHGLDNVIYIGTNGKMNELSAAMGITSLESIEKYISTNKRNYDLYKKLLHGIPGISIHDQDPIEKNNYQYVVLRINEDQAGVTRDMLLEILRSENVLARRYFYPGCHKMEPYRSCYPYSYLLLPKTDYINKRLLQLPTGTAIRSSHIRQVCNIMNLCVKNAELINNMKSTMNKECGDRVEDYVGAETSADMMLPV